MKKVLIMLISIGYFSDTNAQKIDLSKSHGIVNKPIFVVDYLNITNENFYNLKLTEADIKKIYIKNDTIFVKPI